MKSIFKVSIKDRINATTNSKSVKDLSDGHVLRAVNFAIGETTDADTGEVKKVTYIFTENDGVYGATSATIRKSVQTLLDMEEAEPGSFAEISDNGVVEVTVCKRTSKGEREFLQLEF